MKRNKTKQLRGVIMLMAATMIWGTSFVFQSRGNELTGPLTFNLLRCLTAAVSTGLMLKIHSDHTVLKKDNSVIAGIISGTMTFFMTALLQLGMAMGTSVGKAGFLVSTTVIIVPVLSVLAGRKQSAKTWAAVAVAAAGMYLLCSTDSSGFAVSDLLILLSALASALQILALNHYRDSIHSVRVSFLQFLTAAILSLISVILFERPVSMGSFVLAALQPAVILAVLYAGVLASGLAYNLQIESQKVLDPAAVSVLLCFESVFSALAGFIFLHELLSVRELSGCALIFLAAVLSQLPAEKLLARFHGSHRMQMKAR
ncbi:MAG: DMT family transporter [Solobacterium sp.]|nr:DMT family transporter [Solobacterium sp.]